MASLPRRWRPGAALLLAAGLAGCASPGLPKPPSLDLPTPVTDLAAGRAGDTVTLRFTEPARSTDKLPLKGTIVATLCRQENTGSCASVLHHNITASGKSAAITLTDTLPPLLVSGPPVLLTYRVTLYNNKGRAAQPSAPAYAAGGAMPAPVSGLAADASPGGAVLHWQPQPGTDFVELQRTRREEAGGTGNKPASDADGLFKVAPEPAQVQLRVENADAGGTLDASAQFGQSYTYIAWRVRRLTLVGHAVEVSSAPSAPITLAMHDVFPPKVPQELTAVPSSGGPGIGIDLSWEPDTEPDLAGYFVYRANVGMASAPVRLNAAAVAAPAFHDSTAAPGARYRYSVSAVDQSGNESGRSAEVEEGIQ